jgi:hypothetical protein
LNSKKSGGCAYVQVENKRVAGAVRPSVIANLWRAADLIVGNSAYRRDLRKRREMKDKPVFEIDAGKLAQEARFDGIRVLRTNAKIPPFAGGPAIP